MWFNEEDADKLFSSAVTLPKTIAKPERLNYSGMFSCEKEENKFIFHFIFSHNE